MSQGRTRSLLTTRHAVEAWRDRTFRRLAPLRVRGDRSALRFVNAVGFCFTLSHFDLPVASLYVAVCGRRNPRWPKRTHHDPEIGLTWNLKNSLPAERLTYYGKLVRGKPTLVSLGLFPAFCALIREGKGSGDYIVDYRQGRMTRAAVCILEALHERGSLPTPDLRRAVAMHGSERTAEFDRAMAELQRGLWIAKVEEVYDPDFHYRWDLLDNWLPEPLAASRELSRETAVRRLLAAYLRGAGAGQARFMSSLFGISASEVEAGLAALEVTGTARLGQPIRGWPGSWAVWTSDAPCGGWLALAGVTGCGHGVQCRRAGVCWNGGRMEDLVKAVLAFRDERDWRQFHNPKDLAISICLEAAELLEPFQWKRSSEVAAFVANEQNRRRVGEEMADVLILLVSMADVLGIDLVEAARSKLAENARKYPVERAKGNATKYDALQA